VLGRIGRLNALADRVAGGDMTARIPDPQGADEFAALDRHVNTMLDRIEALNAARGRLSDTIAHELRTPLNRIQQHLSQIEGDTAPAIAAQAEMRQTIRVFDALLDISSAEAAKGQKPGLVPVDLSTLTQEVFELYEPLAEEKGLTAQADVEPDLTVLGERSLIAQLLSNLLDNAIKFTPAGEQITLRLDRSADRILMRVEDTGPGLPPEMAERLFERFARAERDSHVPGHGLGLTLVQAIAARHGAKVSRPAISKGFAIEISWPILVRAD
jgi:signal transduction histidine kinase